MATDPNAQKAEGETQTETEVQKTDAAIPEKQEQPELWKDGKPFNAEWAAKKIEELTNENKTLKPKAKRAEELEAEKKQQADAALTESERTKKERDELAAENAKIKSDLLRRDVIAEVGLPASFASRLQGTTKEELLADAQELAKTLPQLKVAPKVPVTNPSNAQTNETEAQLRQRIYGNQTNVFDVNHIREHGGGVLDWTKKD